jgi:hypothetical protein
MLQQFVKKLCLNLHWQNGTPTQNNGHKKFAYEQFCDYKIRDEICINHLTITLYVGVP